ncbi:muscle M-line assembly protein unc-89-like [Physella acuta]|uniref:muscle M-line assembly protein unc-89-like n=1 Tax=Physella acuta TaxID=109671 RepID=UPI0027DE014A|nr:muscle M-line assembly protein unc-89-like [Physella acuta]
MDEVTPVLAKFKYEVALLNKLLQDSKDDNSCFNTFQQLEAKMRMSGLSTLLLLKSMTLHCSSLIALKNLMKLFLRRTSQLMCEMDLIQNSSLASETLKIMKGFWFLCSSQHTALSEHVCYKFSPDFYEILPSLASLYIDLFICTYKSKEKTKKHVRRLYSFLAFELNERCLKTALLEASECTAAGGKLILPILRKLLSETTGISKNNMDYLLHFILLKHWLFVCDDIKDIAQDCLRIKAPKSFLEWLCQRWLQAKHHVPQDKSLKGRRVSELMLELDSQAVEELIDVFAQCLSSPETKVIENMEAESMTAPENLFVIDKKGDSSQQIQSDKKHLTSKRKRESSESDANNVLTVEEINGDDSDFCIISLVDDDDKIPKSKRPKLGEGTTDQGEGTDVEYVEPEDVSLTHKASAVSEKKNAGKDKVIDVYDIDNDSDESVNLPDIKPRKTPQKKNKKTPQKTDSSPGFFVDRTPHRSAEKKTNSDPALHYFSKSLNKSKNQLESEEEMEIQVIDVSKNITRTPDLGSKATKSPLEKNSSDVKNFDIESDEEECSVYDTANEDTPGGFIIDRTARRFINSPSVSDRSAAESPVIDYVGSGKNLEHEEDMEIQLVEVKGGLISSTELSPKKLKLSPKKENSPVKQSPRVENSTIKQSFKKDNSPVKASPNKQALKVDNSPSKQSFKIDNSPVKRSPMMVGSPVNQSPKKQNSPLKRSPSPKKVVTTKKITIGDSSESSSEIDETIISLTKDISNSLKRFKANTSSECSEDIHVESSTPSKQDSDEECSSPRKLTIVVASDSDDGETEASQAKRDKLSGNKNVDHSQDNIAVSDDESGQDSCVEVNSPKKITQKITSVSNDNIVSPTKGGGVSCKKVDRPESGSDNPPDKTPKPVTEDYISKMITEIRLNVSSAQREETNTQSNIRTRLRTKSESKAETPASSDLTVIKPKAQEKKAEVSLRDWLLKPPSTPDLTSNRQIEVKSEPRQKRHTPSTDSKMDVQKQSTGQDISPEKTQTKKATPKRTARKTPDQESSSRKRKSLTQSVLTRNTATPNVSPNAEKTPKMKSTPKGSSRKGSEDTSSCSIQDSLHRKDKSPVQAIDTSTVTSPKPSMIESSPKINKTPKRSARNNSGLSSADETHPGQVVMKAKSPIKTPVQVELKAKSSVVKTPVQVEMKAKSSVVKTPVQVEMKAKSPVKTPVQVEMKAKSPVKTPVQVEMKAKSPVKTPVQVELKAKSPIKIPDESPSNHKVKPTRTEDVFGEPLKTYSLKDRAAGKKNTPRQVTDLNLSAPGPSLKDSPDMDSDSSTSTTASNQSALRKTYFLRGSQKGSPQKHPCSTCQPEQACSNTDHCTPKGKGQTLTPSQNRKSTPSTRTSKSGKKLFTQERSTPASERRKSLRLASNPS